MYRERESASERAREQRVYERETIEVEWESEWVSEFTLGRCLMQMSILIVRALMKTEREGMQWTIDRRRRWKQDIERQWERAAHRKKVKWRTGNSHFTRVLMTGWDNESSIVEKDVTHAVREWETVDKVKTFHWNKKEAKETKRKNTTGCGCKFKVNSQGYRYCKCYSLHLSSRLQMHCHLQITMWPTKDNSTCMTSEKRRERKKLLHKLLCQCIEWTFTAGEARQTAAYRESVCREDKKVQ